jgi:mannosyltransferase
VNPRRHPLIWAAAAVGAFAFAVSFALSWVPSLDFNEAATVISALRPWPALWREIHHVDAVHATYYALMHVWFDLVGYTPLSLRIPASAAAGAAAGLLVVLGRRLAGLAFGVAAGIVFAVLPQTMWMGFEGRQYEASMAFAVGLVLLFLAARDRTGNGARSWPWWAGFAALGIVGQYVFGYLIMLDLGLAALLVLQRRWAALARFAAVAAATVAAWAPLAALELHETGQISWITGIGRGTASQVLVQQYFVGDPRLAVIGWLAAGASAAVGLYAAVRGRRTATRRVVAIALPWLVVPTGILLTATALGHHLYAPRYAAFSAPALALLIAAPTIWLRARRPVVRHLAIAAALSAVCALAAPTWAAQRTPGAKEADAWNQIAAVITAERKEEPKNARNVVVFGAAHAHKVATSQVIADLYPQAFAGMDDITLATDYDRARGLWDLSKPLAQVVSRARGANYVWVLTTVQSHQASADEKLLAPLGFRVREEWRMKGEVVLQLERRAPRV